MVADHPELLVLEPAAGDALSRAKRDYLVAYLVLNGVDFRFADDYTLPRDLPGDWAAHKAVLLFAEDLPARPGLLAAAPGLEALARRSFPECFGLPPNRHPEPPLDVVHRGALLGVRRLADVTADLMEDWFWRADLTLMHAGFLGRMRSFADAAVKGRYMERFLQERQAQALSEAMPGGQELIHCEQSNIVKLCMLDYAELTGDDRFRRQALAMADYYLDNISPDDPLTLGDCWAHCGSFVRAYEATGDQRYLDRAKLHVDTLFRDYQPWEGCYGLWSTDKWLRDSTLCAIGVPLSQIARHYPSPMREKLFDQAAHQFLQTVKYLRDAKTGLYHFGGREGQQCPTLHAHGSQWQAMAFSLMLGFMSKSHPSFNAMAGHFRDLMEACVRYQGPQGFWHQHFDRTEGTYGDMLYTGAIIGALYRGLAFGLLDGDLFSEAAERGWQACKTRLWDGATIGRSAARQVSKNPCYYNSSPFLVNCFVNYLPYLLFAMVEKTRHEKV